MYRFETENDLPEMATAYRQFMADKAAYKPLNDRCKLYSLSKLRKEETWIIDKWWSEDEKVKLGIKEAPKAISINEFLQAVSMLKARLAKIEGELARFPGRSGNNVKLAKKRVDTVFRMEKGKSEYTRGYIRKHKGVHPVYSSQTKGGGVIGKIDRFDYDTDCLTWTTDGVYAGSVFVRRGKFNMTTHCGALVPKQENKDSVYLPYFKYVLEPLIRNETRGEQNKRVTVSMMEKFEIKRPDYNY